MQNEAASEGPCTDVQVGGSQWNPKWAGAVTDRKMTGVLKVWAVPEKSLSASWFLHEWFSR